MSLFLIKSILALFFLAAGVAAVLAMFSLMGKTEHKTSPLTLRKLHRSMGFIFVILLIITTVLCVKYVARAGDQISHRAALHGVLALLLIGALAVKIVIIKWFKGFLNFVPVLGIVVFVLAFAVVTTSAGYFFVRATGAGGAGAAAGVGAEGDTAAPQVTADMAGGDADRGRAVFEGECSSCHAADSDESGLAPGLKGLLRKETLPESGRPATVENVISQLRQPAGMMPSFSSLAGQDLTDLIVYLKTL